MNIKLKCLSGICLTMLSINIFAQGGKMVSSKMKEATVYFRGAELTHAANTLLQKGANEIRISGLSPNLDPNSIKIKTSAGVLVSSFEFTTDYLSEKKIDNTEVLRMEESIKGYQKQVDEINTNLKINKDLLSVLQKSVMKNVEGSEKGLSIEDLIKTMEYFKTKSIETEAQIRLDTDKKKTLEENIYKLRMQLGQESTKNDKAIGVLNINLTSTLAANCDFTISYFTSTAGWIPYYDINVSTTDKPVKFTSRAKVRQTTGMDWENVRISLSTAQPSFGKVAPLFNAWFLTYWAPQRPKQMMAKRSAKMIDVEMAAQNSYSYEEIAVSREVKEDYAVDEITMDDYVQQSENQLNITFNIDLPYSIPGNGKEQSIELKNQEIAAEFKYYCAPKLDIETYVLAEISNWEQLNLLSGKANITYDGTYVGETYIDASSTQEKLVLTLGSDKRVPVKREKLKDYSSTKLLGSDTKQVFTYQLTVKNNQKVPVKMVLKDQYPKSTQKEIEVELLKDTTTPTFNNTDIGVVSWELEMQPGEVKVFKLSYSVKYPKGSTINL